MFLISMDIHAMVVIRLYITTGRDGIDESHTAQHSIQEPFFRPRLTMISFLLRTLTISSVRLRVHSAQQGILCIQT
jgi:hypothetical protein